MTHHTTRPWIHRPQARSDPDAPSGAAQHPPPLDSARDGQFRPSARIGIPISRCYIIETSQQKGFGIQSMSTVLPGSEQRVVLFGISWSTYEAILADVDNPGGRLTYDNGTLEIMSPSLDHERAKSLIGRLIESLTLELELDIVSGGSTTFKRAGLHRGIEPDECYYIQNAAAVFSKEEIDLTVDPPPDLAIEVDISRSSIDKLAIYQSLGIPEVWRYDGSLLSVFVKTAANDYAQSDRSSIFPHLPLDEFAGFLSQRTSTGENDIVRAFRDWVRANLR